MKIYLLQLGCGPPIFYSEGPLERDKVEHKGLRGWLERRRGEIHATLWHSERGIAPLLRKAWAWLSRQTFTDEVWLLRLRGAREIELHHPTGLVDTEAQALWQSFLAHRQRRHLPWLVVDTIICPFAFFLAILPGPNVIGYWFVYRASCHAVVLLGVRKCRSARMPTSFHATPALDTIPGEAAGDTVARAEAALHVPNLRSYLERTTARPFDPHEPAAQTAASAVRAPGDS